MTEEKISPEIRTQLETLRSELNKISPLHTAQHEKAKAIDSHLQHALSSEQAETHYPSIKAMLQESADSFEKEYPALSHLMGGLRDMLASIGI